jgi:hypothetical protein
MLLDSKFMAHLPSILICRFSNNTPVYSERNASCHYTHWEPGPVLFITDYACMATLLGPRSLWTTLLGMQIAESFWMIKQGLFTPRCPYPARQTEQHVWLDIEPSRLLDLVQLQSGLSDQSILTTLNLICVSQIQNWKPSDVKLSSELVERIGDEVYQSRRVLVGCWAQLITPANSSTSGRVRMPQGSNSRPSAHVIRHAPRIHNFPFSILPFL